MASVNDWRFELERMRQKEREEQNRFGWRDLVGLLESATGVYTGIKGVQEAGKRTDLLGEAQDFRREELDYDKTQDALRETARVGNVTRGMESEGYEQIPTFTGGLGDAAKLASLSAGAGEAARPGRDFTGPMGPDVDYGTYHPDLGSTWRAPPPEPTAEEKAASELQILLQGLEATRAWEEGQGGAPGQVFAGGQWQWPPGYGREAGTTDTGPRPTDMRLAFKDIKGYAENDVMNAHPEAWQDGMNGRNFVWTPELQAEATAREQGYMREPQYAGLFQLADPMNDPTNPETRATAREIALALEEGDPETIEAMPELEQMYPIVHMLVLEAQAKLAQIKTMESSVPPGFGGSPGGFATAGSTYAPPPFPPSPGDTTRQWRTIEEILGG